MNFIDSIILGIFQGFSEFLPISSSGHLVILESLFGISSNNIAYEVSVHFGTLLSVVAIYYLDIWKMIRSFFKGITHGKLGITFENDDYFRMVVFILVGTIPAGVVGFFLKDFIAGIFHYPKLVGVMLMVTGIILLSTRWKKTRSRQLNIWNSLFIGIWQAIAILPGISRSGSTISAGLFSGIPRTEAARFSFLLSIPAVLGAVILEGKDLFGNNNVNLRWDIILTGLISSFFVGYLSIRFLLKIIQSGKFSWFAPYCFAVGFLVLLFI